MSDGLKEVTRQQILDILTANPRVEKVVLFGSRAMGTHTSTSDIDLALFGDQLTLGDQAKLETELARLPIAQQADLLCYSTIDEESLKEHISSHGIEWFPWRMHPLFNLADYINGRATKPAEVQDQGIPVIKIAELNGGISAKTNRIPKESIQDKHWVRKGDLLFAWSGSVGIYLYQGQDSALNQHIFRVVAKPGIDQGFMRYLLEGQMRVFDSYVADKRTTMGHVTMQDLKTTMVRVPPLAEQRAIAHILSSLDDKIELNRLMSETLEAMARALFKSWFVDFDPVRAKVEGRDPGLPKHIADLFPSRFVDSELGPIPEGWKVGTLGDVAEHPRRNVRPNQFTQNTKYIALEHMPKQSIALFDWGTTDGIESNKHAFKQGEILFGKLRPYFHKVGVAPVNGVCSTDIVVITPRLKPWFGFVLGHLSSSTFVEYTTAGSTGTRMPRTNWTDMARYKVTLPCESVAAAFTSYVKDPVQAIIGAIPESHALIGLRDALIPKLVSGDLRVVGSMPLTGRVT